MLIVFDLVLFTNPLIGFAVPEEEALRGTLAGAAFPFCIGVAYMILHFFTNREG